MKFLYYEIIRILAHDYFTPKLEHSMTVLLNACSVNVDNIVIAFLYYYEITKF